MFNKKFNPNFDRMDSIPSQFVKDTCFYCNRDSRGSNGALTSIGHRYRDTFHTDCKIQFEELSILEQLKEILTSKGYTGLVVTLNNKVITIPKGGVRYISSNKLIKVAFFVTQIVRELMDYNNVRASFTFTFYLGEYKFYTYYSTGGCNTVIYTDGNNLKRNFVGKGEIFRPEYITDPDNSDNRELIGYCYSA